MFEKNILCIGAGYVGGPTMAMIAAKCPCYKVTVVDIDSARIAAWQNDELPIYEKGLLELVKQARGRNLFFSTEIAENIRQSEIIFVSVSTPTKTYGEGSGMAADLQNWEKAARSILQASDSDKIIVEKSTVPVRTSRAMERILSVHNNGIHFEVLSNPEFLAEGTAIADLENPDRILIGSRETEAGVRARNELVNIYRHWVPADKVMTSNVWSAELSKLTANAFLAQRISSINSISALCEKTKSDVTEVAAAVGADSRIGNKFLKASVGFGGSCFKKDILNLVYICRHYGLNEIAEYWEQVVRINEYQECRFVKKMLEAMFNTVSGKKIALFGFAFKKDTSDTRESPAILITRKLLEENAVVSITDPKALANAKLDLRDSNGRIEFEGDPYKAAEDSHAIALLTEWDLYKELDYERIFSSMVKPAFIFDGRNILDHEKLFRMGFNVYPIGKSYLQHF